MPTRRTVLAGLPAALATPALAQARQPLTVLAYGGVYEKILHETVIPAFEAKHPYTNPR